VLAIRTSKLALRIRLRSVLVEITRLAEHPRLSVTTLMKLPMEAEKVQPLSLAHPIFIPCKLIMRTWQYKQQV